MIAQRYHDYEHIAMEDRSHLLTNYAVASYYIVLNLSLFSILLGMYDEASCFVYVSL